MQANRSKLILLLCLACATAVSAQESKPTIRHHKVENAADAAIARAEAATSNP